MNFFARINAMTVADALLAYLAEGITVFPLRPDDPKVPAVTWKRYQNSTPTLYEARQWISFVRREWDSDILALALATGTHNNLYVLDTDTEAAEAWVRKNAPATPLQAVTRKGRHHFYLPGKIKFTIGVSHGPDHLLQTNAKGVSSTGIDSRGEAGYVVAAPSVVKGFTYRWEYEPAGGPIPTLDALGQAFFVSGGTQTGRRARMAPHGATNAADEPETAYTTAALVAIGCRDFYMRDLVMGIIATHVREKDTPPDAVAVAEEAWKVFQQNCDMSDGVPKFDHCLEKAEYAIQRVRDGIVVIADDDGFPIA